MLELSLVILQVFVVVKVNHFINFVRLVLQVVERGPIRLKSAFQTAHDPRLGLNTVLIELSSIALLSILTVVPHILHSVLTRCLLHVHIMNEFLPPLQIFDSFVCTLLLLFQFDNSVLNLSLLVLLLLGFDNCFHHDIVLRLGSRD